MNKKHSVLAIFVALNFTQMAFGETQIETDTATESSDSPMDKISVHGTLTLSSDYRSRGFSKSSHKPSVQGGIILAHQSGPYLMFWGASATTPNGGSIEADIIAGYTWMINDKNSLDFFYADVNYPGGNFSPNGKSADFGEFGVMYKRKDNFISQDHLSVSAYYSPNYVFGSGKEYYVTGEYSFPVMNNIQLFGSGGYTKQENVAKFQLGSVPDSKKNNYFDYKLGVRGTYKGVIAELAWVGNNINSHFKMHDDRLYMSITKNF